MTNMTLRDEVLKRDVLGRVRTPRARREALLDEFERSGVSGQKFAAMIGVNYQTFAVWVQRRRKSHGGWMGDAAPASAVPSARPEVLRLVEAVVAGDHDLAVEAGWEPLGVDLPGGARLEIHAKGQIALAVELLRALAARPC